MSLSPQRCLNRDSIYSSSNVFRQDAQKQFQFVNSLNLSQILTLIEKQIPICQKCQLKQKNHYCMEIKCTKKQLLCINCDIKSIYGQHYLHDFTYLIPLFSNNVFDIFYKLKRNFTEFNQCINQEIKNIQNYLKKLKQIKEVSDRQLNQLIQDQKKYQFNQFKSNLSKITKKYNKNDQKINNYSSENSRKDIISNKSEQDNLKNQLLLQKQNYLIIQEIQKNIQKLTKNASLSDTFKNVHFITQQECIQKQFKLRTQLLAQIQKQQLKWLQDPKKNLVAVLKISQNIFALNISNYLFNHSDYSYFKPSSLNQDIFISSKKKIIINQIDTFFKYYNQLFTQNLQHHKVQLKIQNQLLNKAKFYEAFIYHFKNCQKLTIDNANITHLKTPLNFRKLKELQFNCNVETDSFTTKIQNNNFQLQSFTIRKFRQEDIKILKYITGPCKKLKSLHIQFFNKTDLTYSKELIEYFEQESNKELNTFVLKIRTQTQVKRLYGYLSKFYREQSQFQSSNNINLNQTILNLLQKNQQTLTKVIIQGVKNLKALQILKILLNMKYLMQFKITYENIDLLTDLDHKYLKELKYKTQMRKRLFYTTVKMSKEKLYSQNILHTIMEEFVV